MTRVLSVVSAGVVVALSVGVVSAMPTSAHRLRQASLLPATFKCTGAEQTYSVPAGVRALKVKAIGAAGSPSSDLFGAHGLGGQGAVVGAWVRLPQATGAVFVEVGCAGSLGVGGFNGGGTESAGGVANGGGGGGASDVRLDPRSTALSTSDTRLVVAGGGGGGGVCAGDGGTAGDSSVTGAGNGGTGSNTCPAPTTGGNGGFGGTAGGGSGTGANGCNGGAGSLGRGGSLNTQCDTAYRAGGGGGGREGGGAGGDGPFGGAGGGAGSSFWFSGATHTSMAVNTTSLVPKVVITPACLVPTLKGKTLAAATNALANAHCALGTVTKKSSTGTAGIVLSQNPKSGTILTIGSKVAVVVSKT